MLPELSILLDLRLRESPQYATHNQTQHDTTVKLEQSLGLET